MEVNNKYISISLFRVSADSQYLDMIFSCPVEYYFTSLGLEVKQYNEKTKNFISSFYDLSEALFDADPESEACNKKHWTVRLPLSKIGIEAPAIYKATLKASKVAGEDVPDIPDAQMICSDVNYAYRCMLNDLLSLDNISDPCVSISDEAIRKYLLLYGHQQALSCGDDEVAERYFKLIGNCFDNCGQRISNCGCHLNSSHSVKNCNCGK